MATNSCFTIWTEWYWLRKKGFVEQRVTLYAFESEISRLKSHFQIHKARLVKKLYFTWE